VGLFEIKDRDLIRTLTDLYENGERVALPVRYPDTEYELKFYSENWPQIYLNISCEKYGDDLYLYDADSRRGIALGDLLDGYFE
jgi:hypothetical protein